MTELPIFDFEPKPPDPSLARPAFFPTLRLQRSTNSETVAIRYHANTSDRFGRGSSLSLYIEPWHLSDPMPEAVEVMIYKDAAPFIKSCLRVVYPMRYKSTHETTHRYDEWLGGFDWTRVGSVYIPKLIFGETPPDACFLTIDFPKGSTGPFAKADERQRRRNPETAGD